MPQREFKLPRDFTTMIELLPPAFQYPENESWSLHADEAEQLVDTLKGVRRIWPLLRLVQAGVPWTRDLMRGYIWEEDGRAVGLSNVMRQGSTRNWYIANVAVLPDYRRRGIARKLVESCVALARGRGARAITLDVIDGNLPASTLYQALGFEHFMSKASLEYRAEEPLPGGPVPDLPLPAGYTLSQIAPSDWRERYELARRLTPDVVQKYVPVEEGTYRSSSLMRLFMPVFDKATGTDTRRFVVRGADSQVVAVVILGIRQRAGGTSQIHEFLLDPAHADLAPALVNFALREIETTSPGRRIEFMVPHWKQAVLNAALAAGFTRLYDHVTMGLVCDPR